MVPDTELCVRAVASRDARFDGQFFTAVRTTRIYCRPSCPAPTPQARNMTFYPTAAAAQRAGYRACKRCRPDTTPGSPEWDVRADVVGRAMRLIGDGVVDREGVPGLAHRLGYSPRQVQRHLAAELGAGPLQLARAQRAQTARLLAEGTDLPLADVAFAAGFGSLRTFNETVQEVYALTPGDLRRRAKDGIRRGRAVVPDDVPRPGRPARPGAGEPGEPVVGAAGGDAVWTTITVRLPYRRPLTPDNLFGHLVATAVPGVEEWRDGAYRSTVALPHGPAIVALAPHDGHVEARLHLADLRDLAAAIGRCRRALDLDADPEAVDTALAADTVLAPLVAAAPGRRVPRTLDPDAFALRAVLGQQVSTAAARTHAARLVRALGDGLVDPEGGLTHVFPAADRLVRAADDPSEATSLALGAALAMPASRRETLLSVARLLASGELDLGAGADWERARARLGEVRGIGPWTVEIVAMRALGDPDAFVPGDLGVRGAAGGLGLPTSPAALTARAETWRPWRAYAVQHLWATGDHAVNRMPTDHHASIQEGDAA
ncbi:AlkA N-terminal domain-containing protein [Luteimicrobium xylanilyticum]|uniref:DNA-3-methyladenine glycosylase II n=1 Tax=Luteimicrobium xylanilyticum TaxID=1133546 RepID=A0A5P9Q7N4_9MICO|nr:AlkA N-terminal domain-containing protein [Luteimicrobium xylanilyticum]QFU97447.1 DNA-3-methyladenine glycosylase II [Luteimicrobium xylanilyticum]